MQTSLILPKSLANPIFLFTFAPQNLNTVKNMTTIIITAIQVLPQRHAGKTLVTFAANGGNVNMDPSLR